jgi:glycosyltransferase involved in cell wall biosynthesis
MTQALIGVWYSKRRKIPHYLYVQDLWPENVEIVTGIHSPLVLKPIGAMVNYIYKRCDVIFATSPSFVKEIQKRVKKNKDKVKYLPQYAEEFYKPVKRKPVPEIPDDDSFKIIFTGNIGKAQGLDILPKAAKLLKGKENG